MHVLGTEVTCRTSINVDINLQKNAIRVKKARMAFLFFIQDEISSAEVAFRPCALFAAEEKVPLTFNNKVLTRVMVQGLSHCIFITFFIQPPLFDLFGFEQA